MSAFSDLPSWWSGGSFTAKAAWLKHTGRAKSFEEACSMLARRRGKPAVETRRVSVENYQAGLEKRGLG